MKSVINSVMRQATLVDYPGRLSGLMFTSGCNFRCGFCHNASSLSDFTAETYDFDKLEEILLGFKKQWTKAISITGGEPTLHKGLPQTIEFIRKHGFQIKLDSNGSNPAMLRQVLPMLNYIAMDIKGPLERYPQLVGYADIERIRESIDIIMHSGIAYEFRTTLVEPYYSDDDFRAMGEAVRGADLYIVQAFLPHPDLPDPALRDLPRTRPSVLEHARDILQNYVKKAVVRGE